MSKDEMANINKMQLLKYLRHEIIEKNSKKPKNNILFILL